MQEAFQALSPATRFLLVLCLAVAWFVGTALAVSWIAGDGSFIWLLFAYALPPGLLYGHFQGAQIKTPALLLLWSVVMGIGVTLAGLELLFAAFLLLDALGLR